MTSKVADDHAFAELRGLADALAAVEVRALRAAAIRTVGQLARQLGALAVPLLARSLHGSPIVRETARDMLAVLGAAPATRERVLAALRALVGAPVPDDLKVCVLGLLAELGEPGAATFADPASVQRRSALALAAQLETPSELANAADMMVRTLGDREIHEMLAVLGEVAPAAAHRLAGELAIRLDLTREQRAAIAAIVEAVPRGASTGPRPSGGGAPPTRPTHVTILLDAAARIVVVASRKQIGERTWRRWALLIGASGCIEDCLHEEAAPEGALDPSATLIAELCGQGYRVTSHDGVRARTLVATAAHHTTCSDVTLGPAYYLGRDLLELGDIHMPAPLAERGAVLAHAIELLATGEVSAARTLFERCSLELAATTDWAAGYGACLLALGEHAAAVAPLERAIAAEPGWPLHHWNLAVALAADPPSRLAALQRFVATSATAVALTDDLDQPARLAHAKQLIAELERSARLDGSLATRQRARSSRPRTASKKRNKPAP